MQQCNQPDRNCWVYDDKGRVVGLANAIVVERCPADLQKEIYIRLYRQFGGKDPADRDLFYDKGKPAPGFFIGKQGQPCYKFDEYREIWYTISILIKGKGTGNMKLLPCAVRGVLAGLMISIGGYVYLGCENRVVGAVFFTVGLITITLFGFDLYTGKIGYWLGQSRQERWQTLLSLPCNAVGCLIAGLARRPAGAVLALCEARLAKAPLTLLVDGIFCGILIFICVEIYKTRGTVLGILICIPTFILCGFEHSIADVFYFCNARIFSGQAVLVVVLVALGNAIGALIIPAARLVYQPKEEQPHWE